MSKRWLRHFMSIAGILLLASMNVQAARDPRPADVTIFVSGDDYPPAAVEFGARGAVSWMYAQIGIRIPVGTAGQWPQMRPVDAPQLQPTWPSDLVELEITTVARISLVATPHLRRRLRIADERGHGFGGVGRGHPIGTVGRAGRFPLRVG